MRSIPRTIALAAVAGIVAVSIGLGAAAPAGAATPNWLNGTKPGQFILNILGSVLGGAKVGTQAGDLKQAVISQDQVWDHSWEGLEQQWKMKTAAGFDVPDTYDEYVLQQQQYFAQKGLTSKQGELSDAGNAKKYVNLKPRFPATGAAKWVKTAASIGAPIVAVAAWDHRADIGAGVGSLVGVDDTTGAVCSNSDFLSQNGQGAVAGFQNWVTGSDCDAWKAAKDYVPNVDLTARPDGWQTYPMKWSCGGSWSDDGYGPCYAVFIPQDPQLPSAGGTQGNVHIVDPYASKRAQNGMTFSWWCKPTSGTTYRKFSSGSTLNFQQSNKGDVQYAWTCPSGTTLYAGLLYTSTYGTDNSAATPESVIPSGALPYAFFAKASPKYVAGLDPSTTQRTNSCTVVGDDGNTYSASSAPYVEGKDPNPGAPLPDVPEGVMTKSVHCVQTGGGSTSDIVPQTDTTPQFQAWWTQYPECRQGACSLQLYRKADSKSCFDGDVVASAGNCADWFADPQKDANYQCMYGAHDVSLTECYVYADVFKPDKVAAGQAYADPTTGESVSGQSSPGAAKTALSKTITDPSDFTGCLDQGWAAANPVEWVLVPIQCALQWAFAPRAATINADVAQLQTTWGDTAPAKVVAAVQSWKINPSPGGCSLSVPFYSVIGNEWTNVPVLQTCAGDPMGGIMPWVRGIVSVVVGIGAAFACRRIVAKWVDYS